MHCKKKAQDYKNGISVIWIAMCTEELSCYHIYTYYFFKLFNLLNLQFPYLSNESNNMQLREKTISDYKTDWVRSVRCHQKRCIFNSTSIQIQSVAP